MTLGGGLAGSKSLMGSTVIRKPGNVVSDQFPAGLRVLVVDDDPTCLSILEKMLRTCRYEVTKTNRAEVALTLLRENRNGFDIVISDVHMPDMDGFKLLECVGLEMDLPVIMMSVDDSKHVVMESVTHGACDYLIKPVRIEALKNIWQHVIRKKGNESKELEQSGSRQEGDYQQKQADAISSPANEVSWKNSMTKVEDEETEEKDDSCSLKKPRIIWSVELHQQFVAAVEQLGIDKAVPKEILELMNVPRLTREKVASHLKKYRLYLTRRGVSQHQGGLNGSFMRPDPTTMEPKQLLGNKNMQANTPRSVNMSQMAPRQPRGQNLNESVGGQVSRIQSSIGQPLQANGPGPGSGPSSGDLSRNGLLYNPVTQTSSAVDFSVNQLSDLPSNGFPIGSAPGVKSISSKGFNQEEISLDFKGTRGYAPNYNLFSEFQQHKSQEWQLQNSGTGFGGTAQLATSVQSNVNQSLNPGQNNMKNVNQNLNSVLVDNSLRVKSEVVSPGSNLFSEHYGQEDLMSALPKQMSQSSTASSQHSGGQTPHCHCGIQASLQISKTSKNPGQKFYSCSRFRCGFFTWADEVRIQMLEGEVDELKNEFCEMKMGIQKLQLVNKQIGRSNANGNVVYSRMIAQIWVFCAILLLFAIVNGLK